MPESAARVPHFHVVQQGESVESIAASTGFLWRTIWDHPDNAALKSARRDPHVLLPGDRLAIPGIRSRELTVGTEARHKLQVTTAMSRLQIRFVKNGASRANLGYVLRVDDLERRGTTDGNGTVDETVSPLARNISLHVDSDPVEDTYVLQARHLNPAADVSGIQMRLRNLGYAVAETDGALDQSTHAALAAFQRAESLRVTGEPDDATVAKLESVHGS